MVKRIKKVTKGKPTRERKKIIVVGSEGKNKTEELYLRYMERTQTKYHFVFATGNDTDPIRLVRSIAKKIKEEDLSFKDGDLAYCLFDLDLDKTKEPQMITAKSTAVQKNIQLITSNPCFEVWYIEHFGYTTKPFNSSAEVIRELKKYIPNYNKNTSNYDELFPLTKDAIKNCKRLEDHHQKNNYGTTSEYSNPHTDVYKLIELLLSQNPTGE